jgi:dUTP pyrophosphatase
MCAELMLPGSCAGDDDLVIPVKLLSPDARVPERAYDGDAAFDLYAAEAATLPPGRRAVIGTGIALGLPPGLAALTLPRSGLAAKHGISIVNAPGLIDPGYRGEVRIILLNTDLDEPFGVSVGDRIAQLLFLPVTAASLACVKALQDTSRGGRGFGSSGTGERA